MNRLLICAILFLCISVPARPASQPGPAGVADEEHDWGVPPSATLRRPPYHAPTPREIPGATVLKTADLNALLAGAARPVLVDVLSAEGHPSLPSANWVGGAGRGTTFFDPVQAELGRVLERAFQGDKERALVFFCANAQCWLSYNAALRAVALGYRRVYWYRGGIEAWRAAGLPLEPLKRVVTPSAQ